MGSGTSLRNADDRIYRHVTIAVNDAIAKFPTSSFYFTADPSMVGRRHWEYVQKSECQIGVGVGLFSNDWLCGMTMERDGVDPARVYECQMGDPQNRDLRMDPSREELLVGSCAQTAAHFAVVLGCNPIYLLGCDCRIVDGRRYFWQYEDEPFTGGLKNENAEVLKAAREEDNDSELSRFVVMQWIRMRELAQGVLIYDASAGLLTGPMPSISMEELLG
jgi:hypothetical protein